MDRADHDSGGSGFAESLKKTGVSQSFCLVQRESNTHRISAALFGSFGLVVLALRQQGCVLRDQNPLNIPRRNVRSSFAVADFRPDEKLDAGNTRRIAKGNCDVWAEIRPSKPMRVRLPLDYSITGTKFRICISSMVTSQSTARTSTPPAAASRSAFPNSGSVASLGCKYSTSVI